MTTEDFWAWALIGAFIAAFSIVIWCIIPSVDWSNPQPSAKTYIPTQNNMMEELEYNMNQKYYTLETELNRTKKQIKILQEPEKPKYYRPGDVVE